MNRGDSCQQQYAPSFHCGDTCNKDFLLLRCSDSHGHKATLSMQRSVAVLLAAAAGASIGMPRASAFQGALAPLRVPVFGKNQPKSDGWISHVPSLPFRPAHLRLKGGLSSGILSAMTTTSATEISAPVEKFRKDYKVPDYSIVNVELTFKIFKGQTQVQSTSESAISSGCDGAGFGPMLNTAKLYFRRFFHRSR